MTAWLSQYWYVLTGIGGALALFALHMYALRNPDSQFASQWERAKYAAVACAPIGGLLMLASVALEVFAPQYSIFDLFFSPYFGLALFVVCWFAAPILKRWFPS